MGRARLTPGDDTVEIKVRIAAGDRNLIAAAAKVYGVTLADFARRAMLAAARGATKPGEIPMDRLVPPRNPGPIIPARVAGGGVNRARATPNPSSSPPRPEHDAAHPGRDHVAGKELSGGINPCTLPGCAVRKVLGRWVEAK